MRAQTHSRRDKPHPAHRHVSVMARVTPNSAQPTSHAPHIAHSHTAYKHATPTRPRVPHSHNHCEQRKHHCTHTAARTSHTARHTALTTPHTAHRKSHPVTHAASAPHSRQSCQAAQRRRDAAGELVVAQVQLPAGHTNSHRVTPWHPTPTPASRPQRISAHRIASIKSTQMKDSQHTACYRSRTTPCATDPRTTQPDSPQVPDAVIPLDKSAPLRRSRTSQRDTQRRHARANKRSTHNNKTATTSSK
jgi:hypothetical protein